MPFAMQGKLTMSIQAGEPSYLDGHVSEGNFLWVKQIHTLGPAGTNCEKAALKWVKQRCPNARLFLHASMEEAAQRVARCGQSVLLSVMAYPQLHSIIYEHITALRLMDVFIMNTDNMVLASSSGRMPRICATHPAPEKLLPPEVERRFAGSNVLAAAECAEGRADGCITTLCAAEERDLKVLRKFGPVPMGFTIHGPLGAPNGGAKRPLEISNQEQGHLQ